MSYSSIIWLNGFVASVANLGQFFIPSDMFHDFILRALASGSEWDKKSTPYYQKYVQANDVVMDIGAFNGSRSIRLSQLVGPGGTVLAWEPQSDMCRQMYLNLALNAVSNVVVHPYAAGRAAEQKTFYLNPNNRGGSGMYSSERLKDHRCEVFVKPIDSFMPAERVSFMKIDVEGAELDVLHGAQNLLKRDHPVLYIEIWNDEKRACEGVQATKQEVLNLLRSLDYDVDNAQQVSDHDFIMTKQA